jgi:phosphotriesterase-related protein
MRRRSFMACFSISVLLILSAIDLRAQTSSNIVTVNGVISPDKLGRALIHEHILVDFIGAKQYSMHRWDDEKVIAKVLPYLKELRDAGCNTIVDCTPNYLGRDVALLKKLSALSGLHIITNTGYYGGSDNKYLADHVFNETPEQLSARWMQEWSNGIDGTGIKPGFMKISVNPEKLSDVSMKLIRAAAITHLQTGLTIASHTGPAIAALEEIEILKREGVHPSAFIWVHAQNEKNKDFYDNAIKEGAWVSLDGLSDSNVDEYVSMLISLKQKKLLDHVLVSHDAGWYDPSNPEGEFRGYTVLFRKLIPSLLKGGFTQSDIDQLIVINPREAFSIRVRKK